MSPRICVSRWRPGPWSRAGRDRRADRPVQLEKEREAPGVRVGRSWRPKALRRRDRRGCSGHSNPRGGAPLGRGAGATLPRIRLRYGGGRCVGRCGSRCGWRARPSEPDTEMCLLVCLAARRVGENGFRHSRGRARVSATRGLIREIQGVNVAKNGSANLAAIPVYRSHDPARGRKQQKTANLHGGRKQM